MLDALQKMIESKLKEKMEERGLSLSRSDLIDWLQEQVPVGDDTLGRAARTLTSQFWGSMFRLSRLEEHLAECEVWATPKKLRKSVHPGVVLGSAVEMVLTLWHRNVLLHLAEVKSVGVRSEWTEFPNGVFVRYQLTEEEIQRGLDQARREGSCRVDCIVKVCNQDSCVIGEIVVICEISEHTQLLASASE